MVAELGVLSLESCDQLESMVVYKPTVGIFWLLGRIFTSCVVDFSPDLLLQR